jgi:hypothetical protein
MRIGAKAAYCHDDVKLNAHAEAAWTTVDVQDAEKTAQIESGTFPATPIQ